MGVPVVREHLCENAKGNGSFDERLAFPQFYMRWHRLKSALAVSKSKPKPKRNPKVKITDPANNSYQANQGRKGK